MRGIKEVCLFAAVIRYYAAKQILCNIYVISETTGYTSEHKISLSPSGADYGPTLTQRNQIWASSSTTFNVKRHCFYWSKKINIYIYIYIREGQKITWCVCWNWCIVVYIGLMEFALEMLSLAFFRLVGLYLKCQQKVSLYVELWYWSSCMWSNSNSTKLENMKCLLVSVSVPE